MEMLELIISFILGVISGWSLNVLVLKVKNNNKTTIKSNVKGQKNTVNQQNIGEQHVHFAKEKEEIKIDEYAIEILQAARDKDIRNVKYMKGETIQCGIKSFSQEDLSPSLFAKYKRALNYLESVNYISPLNMKRTTFELTADAYEYLENLEKDL